MAGQIIRFLSEVVRLLSASAFWCAVAQVADVHFGVTQANFTVTSPVRYAGAAGDEIAVVSFAPSRCDHHTINIEPKVQPDICREITRITPDGNDTRIQVRMPLSLISQWTVQLRGSDGLAVTGKDWWYVTLDDRAPRLRHELSDGTAAATFVKSDGSRKTYVMPPSDVPQYAGPQWGLVAVPGEQPRVLELTPASQATATLVRELDWSGASRSWRLPPVRLLWPFMTAERLPDGRIALFSNDAGLAMYLLSDGGNVDTVALRNLPILQFDTAIDDAGRIAIAVARRDPDRIEAAVIDVANPGKAEWYPLRNDTRVTGLFRELQVVSRPGGFAAAWINERDGRRTIEASELSASGHGGAIVEVGQASPRGNAAFFDVQATQDELRFWWDDGEHLFQRRLPASLTAYAAYSVVRDFMQRFCTTEKQRSDR